MEAVTIAAILSLAICDAPPTPIARPIMTGIRACVQARLRYTAAKYLIGEYYRSQLFESYLQICYAWTGKEALGVLSFVRL